MNVTPDTILGELLEEVPATEDVIRKYLGEAFCLHCPGKMFDTIGNGAFIHGLSDAEMENMVFDLQQAVNAAEKNNV